MALPISASGWAANGAAFNVYQGIVDTMVQLSVFVSSGVIPLKSDSIGPLTVEN